MELIPDDWSYEDVFDGTDLGCGELLYDLRLFFESLPEGRRVVVASRDPGSPLEIPAWCRMTRHRLLEARPPYFLVAARSNDNPEGR